jgi:hypothetical protein
MARMVYSAQSKMLLLPILGLILSVNQVETLSEVALKRILIRVVKIKEKIVLVKKVVLEKVCWLVWI